MTWRSSGGGPSIWRARSARWTSPARSSQGDVGSGDALIRTMRLTAAALAAMAKAAHISLDPARGPGAARDAGTLLSRAMDALAEAAKDVRRHRAAGNPMGMTD